MHHSNETVKIITRPIINAEQWIFGVICQRCIHSCFCPYWNFHLLTRLQFVDLGFERIKRCFLFGCHRFAPFGGSVGGFGLLGFVGLVGSGGFGVAAAYLALSCAAVPSNSFISTLPLMPFTLPESVYCQNVQRFHAGWSSGTRVLL